MCSTKHWFFLNVGCFQPQLLDSSQKSPRIPRKVEHFPIREFRRSPGINNALTASFTRYVSNATDGQTRKGARSEMVSARRGKIKLAFGPPINTTFATNARSYFCSRITYRWGWDFRAAVSKYIEVETFRRCSRDSHRKKERERQRERTKKNASSIIEQCTRWNSDKSMDRLHEERKK